jgi:hypothetical protein
VIGEGQQILKWTKSTIRRLADKIKEGTKFFVGHGATNDHDNRASVGEVLVSFLKDIGGKLSNVIIGHFPDENKVKDMDVCSMESDIEITEDIVSDINDVTGIALGSSDRESPAFPGALRLGTVHCFNIQAEEKNNKESKKMELTVQDVKKAISDLNIFPWQLYSIDDMKNDRVFGKLFSENQTLKSDNERLNKEKLDLESKSKEALRKLDIDNARKEINNLMSEGFTDKQKKFISDRFKPESMEDLSKESLNTFIENGKKEFAETARLFGVDETINKGTDKGETEETPESLEEEALKLMGVK